MNLPFMTKWADGKPTHFIPKIWKSIYDTRYDIFKSEFIKYTNEENIVYLMDDLKKYTSKLHTIRKGNRWRAGDKIHFCINNRSKDYFRFAPVIEVVSVQEIEIERNNNFFSITIDGNEYLHIYQNWGNIDEIRTKEHSFKKHRLPFSKYYHKHEDLALFCNDGFDNMYNFFKFFLGTEEKYEEIHISNGKFKGQIIHWTDLKY